MNALKSVKEKNINSDEDYHAGYNEGFRYGGCSAVLSRIPHSMPTIRNLCVLYVTQGFDGIDGGVSEALGKLVHVCIIASPRSMLQEAMNHRPDLVLVMNALHVFPPDHAEQIRQIKQMGIHTVVWFVDDPYFSEDTASLSLQYDEVFTHELGSVSFYQGVGCPHVHYLPLASNPEMFRPLHVAPEYQNDICFIGNAFWNRVKLFDQLAPFLEDKKVLIAGGHWDRLAHNNQLSRAIKHGWIPVEDTVSYYNGAKIVINMHRPTAAGQDNRNGFNLVGRSINPRTYEISGCGTLQITDLREDLISYYRPGYDIETFVDAAELQYKIDYYLRHEEERQLIAWRSLWTTHQYHTYIDRLTRLLDMISIH
jgi:spore maturation protein CgeB